MITCCICGAGFKSNEDIIIYGCRFCCKGFSENVDRTSKLKPCYSKYSGKHIKDGLKMPLDSRLKPVVERSTVKI